MMFRLKRLLKGRGWLGKVLWCVGLRWKLYLTSIRLMACLKNVLKKLLQIRRYPKQLLIKFYFWKFSEFYSLNFFPCTSILIINFSRVSNRDLKKCLWTFLQLVHFFFLLSQDHSKTVAISKVQQTLKKSSLRCGWNFKQMIKRSFECSSNIMLVMRRRRSVLDSVYSKFHHCCRFRLAFTFRIENCWVFFFQWKAGIRFLSFKSHRKQI